MLRPYRRERFSEMIPQTLLSGEAFQTICDVSWMDAGKINFHTSLSKTVRTLMINDTKSANEGKVLFVYCDLLDKFIENILPHRVKPFVLVTHNSDHSITETYLRLLENPLLIHMYSQNTFINHPKLTALPIGIANSQWVHGNISNYKHMMNSIPDKKKFVYANVNKSTNMDHRTFVLDTVKQYPFVHMVEPTKDHLSYIKELSEYKWAISPKGNGVDCHRLWECLYAKVIPLVDDTVNARQFKQMGFPIILVSDWNKLSIEQLEKESAALSTAYSPKLYLSYWKKMFQTESYSDMSGSIVLVYIGQLRDYMVDTLKQIRLWNPDIELYVAVSRLDENKDIIGRFQAYRPNMVYLEDLEQTPGHQLFHQNFKNYDSPFWKYTMERFFYVEECMRKYHLTNVVHHEFDNMIYFRVSELVALCSNRGTLQIPSDSDTRFIAGVSFIPSADKLELLNEFFSRTTGGNEMETVMKFYQSRPDVLESWPIVPPEYKLTLKPNSGAAIANPVRMMGTEFNGVFDAAAIGQYIGGIDPIHDKNNTDGYISPDCAFRCNELSFQWRKPNGLYQLWVSADQSHWYQIYNLHIHNKNMSRWLSDISEMKAHLPNITVE
jgi:hypothetical protein